VPDLTAPPDAVVWKAVDNVNQTPRDQLANGGHLRIGLTEWTADWNPWSAALPAQLAKILDAVRPRLFNVTGGGELQPNPDWLDGVPTVENDPVTRVVYHLNPAAVWGDGRPVGVADFQAAWHGCADPAADRPCSAGQGFEAIVSIEEGETPHDIVVVYTGLYPDWALTFLHGPVRADPATGDPFAVWDNPAACRDSQAGPYTIVAMAPDGGNMTLVANPWWWGDAPLLDSVTAYRLAPGELTGSLRAGEYDAWPIGTDPAAYAAASIADNLQLRRSPSPSWRVLLLDQNNSILSDRHVRQAIVDALDRTALAGADLPGLAWSPEAPDSLAWQPGQARYADLAASTGLPGDAAAAATLLDEAGWTLEDGQRQKDGEKLSLVYGVAADDPLSESAGLQLRVQLAAIGVEVILAPQDTVAAGPLSTQGLDLVTVTWANGLSPAQRLQAAFSTGSPANQTGYGNPTVDSLLATARQTADLEAQDNLIAAADATLWRDAVAFPLYSAPDTWAAVPNLANFGPSGLAELRWQDVGFANS
jgi:peptide/nickel transport system substrate-binding protein